MKKGGYQIVDFGDTNITSTEGATIAGVYPTIEASHRKALLISGVTLEGVEQRDCWIDCVVDSGNYKFTAYGKTFTVTPDNKVTIE